jgi:translation initiation factor 1
MSKICEKCGLPENLCVCQDISKEQQKIRIKTTERRFRKVITIISGIEDQQELKELGKTLKKTLACGGTTKKKEIELQGNHKQKVKEILIKQGYKEELISD